MLGIRRKNTTPLKRTWTQITPGRYSSDNHRNVPLFSKSIGFFLPQLTRKAFENFGFSTASLILDWPQIVGADLAKWTAPEEIKWSSPKPTSSSSSSSAEDPKARSALLLLRVDPSHILEASYCSQQILDRINSYFGYRAITQIRLLSAPLSSTKGAHKSPALSPLPPAVASPMTSPDCDPLERALQRLATHLQTSSSSQAR